LGKSDAILVAVIENCVPELVTARKAIGDFQSMIRSKSAAKLDGWIELAKDSCGFRGHRAHHSELMARRIPRRSRAAFRELSAQHSEMIARSLG